jgi:hypothetical protein
LSPFHQFLHADPTTDSSPQANGNHDSAKYAAIYNIYEKVQVTAFCIQEFIISGLYVYETRKFLKPSETFRERRAKRVMKHLIYINLLIIFMDMALLVTEYANLYEIQTTLKGAVYGVKLKLEFIILNQLMEISKGLLYSENQSSIYTHGFGRKRNIEIDSPTFSNSQRSDSDARDYAVFAGPGQSRADLMDYDDKTTEVELRDSRCRAQIKIADVGSLLKPMVTVSRSDVLSETGLARNE